MHGTCQFLGCLSFRRGISRCDAHGFALLRIGICLGRSQRCIGGTGPLERHGSPECNVAVCVPRDIARSQRAGAVVAEPPFRAARDRAVGTQRNIILPDTRSFDIPPSDLIHGTQRGDTRPGSIRRPQAEVSVRVIVDLHAVSCRGAPARTVDRHTPVAAIEQNMAACECRGPDRPAADPPRVKFSSKPLI